MTDGSGKRKAAQIEREQPPTKKQVVEESDVVARILSNESVAFKAINTIRCLAAALPQAAKSGHPGAPMGLAVVAFALWGTRMMQYSPKEPKWWNRDRFVLSNGHACALLYTMLHLTGYPITKEDLQQFRQIRSLTPGHPEAIETVGIEVTTGPLGQGIAQAVGLAIAATNCAADFNKPEMNIFDNKIFCIVGDGCLQEGISSEACSLAGHLKLNNLIVLYDDNQITIDGATSLSFTEDVDMRFKSHGWNVLRVDNGDTNITSIIRAIEQARDSKDKPTIIRVSTTIGYGSAMQGTAKVHGAPLGEADLKAFRTKCGFGEDMWEIDNDSLMYFRERGTEAHASCEKWHEMQKLYKKKYPELYAELERRFNHELPKDWEKCLPTFSPADKAEATRTLSEKVLNALRPTFPELIGGSADLMESNKTDIKVDQDFTATHRSGKRIRFGVREHAMVAICNGIFAFGCYRPFSATFLNFYTYAWGACRLSAVSQFGTIMIATHDSIDLGEDGPTHQPIETAALMRATPNFNFIRPCDGNEVSGAYAVALKNPKTPVCIALSRGNCAHLKGTSWDKVQFGAYILEDFDPDSKGRKIVIAGSGSEVQEAVAAAEMLRAEGNKYNVRVVSMPSWLLFEAQPRAYQTFVIPMNDRATCVYIEALGKFGWSRYFDEFLSCGMTSFGASGPGPALKAFFHITAKDLVEKIKASEL